MFSEACGWAFSHPKKENGREVHELIKSCPPLDLNSLYYYYLFCNDFSSTCVVAKLRGEIVGFLSGYLKPNNSQCYFVWQVAVSKKARRLGLAFGMLSWLMKQSRFAKIQCVETTITPSNLASLKLFKSFAKNYNANMEKVPFLGAEHFSDSSHEAEFLFRIKPLDLPINR